MSVAASGRPVQVILVVPGLIAWWRRQERDRQGGANGGEVHSRERLVGSDRCQVGRGADERGILGHEIGGHMPVAAVADAATIPWYRGAPPTPVTVLSYVEGQQRHDSRSP